MFPGCGGEVALSLLPALYLFCDSIRRCVDWPAVDTRLWQLCGKVVGTLAEITN